MRRHVTTARLRSHGRATTTLIVLALATVACGGGGGGGEAVTVSGSSTLEPISALNGEKFSQANPGIAVSVDGPGTGDGFERFCNDETDISDASRAITDEEARACTEAGIEYAELKIAIDGLSVLTAPENDAVACLDFRDLYALLGPESQGFGKWSDADDLAAELGAGNAPYPDEDLVVTAPGEESGTFDSFVELVLEDVAEERGQEATTRPDYVSQGNDNVIIEGIADNPFSLGWVGFAFAAQNVGRVKPIAIDGGEGCVEPSPDTIADGTYPIARPLFIYVNLAKATADPAVKAYVDFYLSDDGRASVSEVGYVELTDEEWGETVATWEAAVTAASSSS